MTTYVLNLIDLLCTLYALPRGCVELNPLMQCVPLMVCYKTIVVGALCLWLARLKRRGCRAARVGITVTTAAYGLLCVYHLIGIIFLMEG